MCIEMLRVACGGQRKIPGSPSGFSTVCVPGLELKLLALAVAIFAHWAILPTCKVSRVISYWLSVWYIPIISTLRGWSKKSPVISMSAWVAYRFPGKPGLHIDFQVSLGYWMRSCIRKLRMTTLTKMKSWSCYWNKPNTVLLSKNCILR